MASRITAIVFDTADPEVVARFWAAALDRNLERSGSDPGEWLVVPKDDPESYILLFQKVPERKTLKNRVHLDMNPVGIDQEEEVKRLEALGARRIDIGQGEVSWIVLADPEGNELCLLSRRLEA